MALVCGNTMVMKPSERDPGACMILMELANEAGFPPGMQQYKLTKYEPHFVEGF